MVENFYSLGQPREEKKICRFKIGGIRVHVKTQNMVHYMVVGEKNYNKKYILKKKLVKWDIERIGVDSFSFCAKCEFDILDVAFFLLNL